MKKYQPLLLLDGKNQKKKNKFQIEIKQQPFLW